MRRIVCDKCNNKFKVAYKDVRTEIIGDIEIKYFICRKCKEKYIIYYEDETLKGLKELYKELIYEEQNGFTDRTTKSEREKVFAEMIAYVNTLKEVCNKYLNKTEHEMKDIEKYMEELLREEPSEVYEA
ncbi:variable large family protein [Clostridioides difficile]|nr:variable large family protein [Clostridioides difficile]